MSMDRKKILLEFLKVARTGQMVGRPAVSMTLQFYKKLACPPTKS